MNIQGHVDSNWIGNVTRRRFTSIYVFQLFDGALSWMNKQQVMVTLSTIEAKNVATTNACKDAICLMKSCFGVGLS